MPELVEKDPWIDDNFSRGVDTRQRAEAFSAAFISDPDDEPLPDDPAAPPVPDVPDTPPAPDPTPKPPAEPKVEVIPLTDGDEAILKKLPNGGYEATLKYANGSGDEVFHASTKDDLIRELLKSKLNATKKIRSQNREARLRALATVDDPTATPTTEGKKFSVDDKFKLKTELAADPDAAIDGYVKNKTGMSLEQIASAAKKISERDAADQVKKECNAFMQLTPEYYMTPENGDKLLAYLKTYNLPITAKNLTTAFDKLSDDGLLEMKPVVRRAPVVEPIPDEDEVAATPATAPESTPPVSPRIGATTRRPRGAFGLSPSKDSTATVNNPVEDKELSDDEANKLSLPELKKRIDAERSRLLNQRQR